MPPSHPLSAFHYPPVAEVANGAAMPWRRAAALFAGLHLAVALVLLYAPEPAAVRTQAGEVVMVSVDAAIDGGRPDRLPPPREPLPPTTVPPATTAAELPPPLPAMETGNIAPPEAAVAATPTTSASAPADTTAAAAPPAAAGADKAVADSYFSQLKRWLDQNKRYPVAAKKQKQQGVAVVTFTIDRRGQLLSSRIHRSSGHAVLDEAALALLARAAPMPRLPEGMTMPTLTLTLPIDYSLITQ